VPVAVVMSIVTAMLMSMRLCHDYAHACGRDCGLDLWSWHSVTWRDVACGRGYGLDVGAFMDVGASRGRGQRSWTWTSICHGHERERAPSWTSVDAITGVVVDIDQTRPPPRPSADAITGVVVNLHQNQVVHLVALAVVARILSSYVRIPGMENPPSSQRGGRDHDVVMMLRS
jgi:hypothetical protein